MSEELFRFMVVRQAEPVTPSKVIRIALPDGIELDDFGDVEPNESTIETWVGQLATIARIGREDDGKVEDQARALDIDLQSAQREVHRLLLKTDSSDHLALADAARGIAMVQEVLSTRAGGDVIALAAMARALLVAKPAALLRPAPSTVSTPIPSTADPLVVNQPTFLTPMTSVSVELQPRPVGFAELEVVRQQVLRYEAGEVAHIENVLAGESRERIHRTLDRTEDVSIFETETRRDESRNLQSTERFELASEARQQIERRNEYAVGTSISASYGPAVEVGIEASIGGSSARTDAANRATAFSREVTDEAASAVSSRIREERKRTLLSEVEETNRHAIENAGSSEHVLGVYQWVDKVMQAQVFSYGERLLYDLVLPEPGAFLSFALSEAEASKSDIEPPPTWELQPAELQPQNWLSEAAKYRAADVNSPPSPLSMSTEIKIEPGSAGGVTTHTAKITPPEGYRPVSALIAVEVAKASPKDGADLYPELIVSVAGKEKRFDGEDLGRLYIGNPVGNNPSRLSIISRDPETVTLTFNDVEPGDIPVAIAAAGVTAGAATVTVSLKPTNARLDEWRHTAYTQIRQSHESSVAAYEAALAGAAVNAGIEIEGRSPSENRQLERDEIKKQAITAFTQQHFSLFGGVTMDDEYDYPQLDVGSYLQQGRYIRFFEQAIEWENVSWVLYPYYWGRKSEWLNKFATLGADPQLVSFLRAGAARVVLPIRPGFQLSMMHYQATSEIWEGGDPPQVHDESYLPFVQEIAEQLGRPGEDETPVGESWEVRLPTDLVRLNPDGTLPRWSQDDNGHWQPAAEGSRS